MSKIYYILLLLSISIQLKSQNHIPVIYNSGDNFKYTLISVAQEYIMRSTNGGITWNIVYQGVSGEQFYTISFIDSNVGFVMGCANESKIGGVVKTIDGGINWVDQASSLPDIISNLNIDSSTKELSTSVYVGGSSGLHLRYNNDKWENVSRGGFPAWTEGIYAFNDSVVIGCGSGIYTMSRTINSGKIWYSPNTSPNELMTDLSFNGNIGYAITSQINAGKGRLFKSIDKGSTWYPVETSIFSNDLMIDIINIDSDNWFICGATLLVDDAKLWKSTNGGLEWIDISSNLPSNVYGLRNMAFKDINHLWISTEDGKVLYTKDAGKSWTIFNTPIDNFNYGLHDIFLLK